ncbi:hypothetical protein BCR36DRAFT_300750 [Piromyces finnis]|uniref:Right handed beta helix domain-containing protein n=1 Tax=Piromyces finnis TaxID=1754191 RepID=A0A1Y1V0Y7_9FUNG|nr:hypothetical protein BCR36DRAFT_300750 [Piromyces finnis]|eukprot:ORX44835.1 hypothetical protein BCR36DRAFT_300750 [Piromyces finnis]
MYNAINVILNNFYLLIFLNISLILISQKVKATSIKNEYDLNNIIKKKDQSNLILNIDSNINISSNISIMNSFQKISFIGNDKDSSVLKFTNKNYKIYFSENVKEIEIINITLYGNLQFNNNIIINLNSTSINGNIYSNSNKKDGYINISNVTYRATSVSTDYCVDLSGNIEIDNSLFFGSTLCGLRLFNFNGLNKYYLKIKDTYFNGEYKCSCLSINRANDVNIYSSSFENGYNSELNYGGGGIYIIDSKIFIQYCTFKNIFSEKNGGVLHIDNALSFTADHIDVYNSTSVNCGSMAYITTEYENNSELVFKNFRQFDTGIEKEILDGGTIMILKKNAKVSIDNYYAENIISNHCANAFTLEDHSKILVKNIYISNIRTNCWDSVFINTVNSKNVNIRAVNVTINEAYQVKDEAGLLLWLNDNSQANLTDECPVTIDNLEVKNFKSNTYQEFIVIYTISKEKGLN